MLLLRKLVLQRHFISLFLSIGRNGIGSHELRNIFRLASTTVACVVHSGAQIIALCFSAQTHRLCFASNTDLIVPKAKHLCPLAPGLRKRRSDWQQAPPPQMNQERVAASAPRAEAATRSCTLFWGGEGKRKKTFAKPCPLPLASLTRFISCASDPWLITCKVSAREVTSLFSSSISTG